MQIRTHGLQILTGKDKGKQIKSLSAQLAIARQNTNKAASKPSIVRGAFVVLEDDLLAKSIISGSPSCTLKSLLKYQQKTMRELNNVC